MRSRLALAARLALVASACASSARAGEPSATTSTTTTEVARAHFRAGMKGYQDRDYAGALAEFEAAYTAKPGPGSLQNIALCQKALFRYGDAVDSLARLLERHGSELSDAERTAAQQAKAELEALVGTVRIEVTPADADVTLDGLPFPATDRSRPLRLNAGDHTLVASAPGHAPGSRSLRVAPGQEELAITLALAPTAGFLDVRAKDVDAAIAVDGKPVAYGRYFGPVTPGATHLVQIYKEGSPAFETRVSVELGATAVVSNAAAPADAAPSNSPSAGPTSARERASLGGYVMGSFTAYVASAPPFRFDLSEATSHTFGAGVRAGWRVRAPIAVEALVAYSGHTVKNACDTRRGEVSSPPVACGTSDASGLDVAYTLRSVRFGPTLALMSTGPRLRALGGVGLGLVWHELRCEGCLAGAEQKSNGVDGYFLAEVGVGANAGHMVMALALQTIIDGTKNLISGRNLGTAATPIPEDAYARSNHAAAYVGLDLRLGFSAWAP